MPRLAKPLSAKAVESAKTTRVQQDLADGEVRGLTLRLSRAGSKTWLLSYKANGKNRRMKLGTFPALSLSSARNRAREELVRVQQGEDPGAEREDRRKGRNTFKSMADEIRTKELDVRKEHGTLRASTFREWTRILDNELIPAWGDRPVAEISRRDVRELAEKIAARGARQMASRVTSFVSFLFNAAIDRAYPTLESNPAHRMRLPWKEEGRDRYLTAKEIKAVWTATAPDIPGIGSAFRIALLTAQRMGSVAAMRWDGIEENGKGWLWTIPEEHFKGKRAHLVPLAPEVVEIIEAIREAPADDVWLFPSRPGTPKERPYLQSWGPALSRIRKRTEIPQWTVHDFRTTFRTHATRAVEDEGLGILGPVADAVLGHAENSLGYRRYQGDQHLYLLAEKREALVKWGAWVRQAIKEKQP